MDQSDKFIRDAQYRKGLSIAFFNATNAGIAIVAPFARDLGVEEIKQAVVMYRDFFLEEHKNYYAKVIANVGQVYNVQDTFAKLRNTKTLDELRSAWVSLSEDERRNVEVQVEVSKLKKSYEKT